MKTKKDKKHLFLDLDGTVTPSRQNITEDAHNLLGRLRKAGKNIIVISGAQEERMLEQLKGCEVTYLMPQSGNNSPFWKKPLLEEHKKEILEHIRLVKDFCQGKDVLGDEEDLTEDRGSQISFSFLGHHADVVKKKAFDPGGNFRKEILGQVPFGGVKTECRVAGTTCYDYTHKNSNKGTNINKLIEHLGWDKDDCIYFGDALFPGGNDETVIGVIDTVQVANPVDLMLKLKEYYEE